MFGHRLHTKQTGADGLAVDKILVTEQIKYDSKYYLAIIIDREVFSRSMGLPVLGFSPLARERAAPHTSR